MHQGQILVPQLSAPQTDQVIQLSLKCRGPRSVSCGCSVLRRLLSHIKALLFPDKYPILLSRLKYKKLMLASMGWTAALSVRNWEGRYLAGATADPQTLRVRHASLSLFPTVYYINSTTQPCFSAQVSGTTSMYTLL